MKVEAKIMDKTYIIDWGDGKQKVYWIATTACSLFGEEHYPSGIYVPSYLYKVDAEENPHPQLSIRHAFTDGDKVEIKVKGLEETPDIDEESWYEQAFGKERYMMIINITYIAATEVIKNKNSRVFMKIKNEVFEEIAEEFKDSKEYPEEFEKEMVDPIVREGYKEFLWEIKLPYGDVSYEYYYTLGDGEEEEKKPLPDKDLEKVTYIITPKEIVSARRQQELDKIEEDEIKQREKDQKEKHKTAMDEKKKEAKEREKQAEIQEQNSLKLDVYWKAMQLNFHKNIDDASASLSVFSLYYETITDYFRFYAALQYQFYKLKENEFITLHSFMHFLKLFGIATKRDEIREYFLKLDTLIIPPPENVLNVKNGLNMAQFLEAILRIVDFQAEESKVPDDPDNDKKFRIILQSIFQDGYANLQNKIEEDRLFAHLYTGECQMLFNQNYQFLGGIYQQKAVNTVGLGLGLTFEDFYSILEEAGKFYKSNDWPRTCSRCWSKCRY